MTLEAKKTFIGQQTGQVAVGTFFIGATSSQTSRWTYVETGFTPRAVEMYRASTESTSGGRGQMLKWHEGMFIADDSTARAGTPGSSERDDNYHCLLYTSSGAQSVQRLFMPCSSHGGDQFNVADIDSNNLLAAWTGTTDVLSSEANFLFIPREKGFFVGCSTAGPQGNLTAAADQRAKVAFYVTG